VPPPSESDRELARLEAELRRLEAEYNMYFSGRAPRPPWETRARVAAALRQYEKAYVRNTSYRFRFSTIQARFAAFVDLWDRALRAKEEGRPGPLLPRKDAGAADGKDKNRAAPVEKVRDPDQED
jgi:hypothetical protein